MLEEADEWWGPGLKGLEEKTHFFSVPHFVNVSVCSAILDNLFKTQKKIFFCLKKT